MFVIGWNIILEYSKFESKMLKEIYHTNLKHNCCSLIKRCWCFCYIMFSISQFSSVAQLCPTLCDPMDYSMPGFPVHHQFPELAQTHAMELVMPSNHLILCHPLLLLPSIFPSIRVFSNESVLHIRWLLEKPEIWLYQHLLAKQCLFFLICFLGLS